MREGGEASSKLTKNVVAENGEAASVSRAAPSCVHEHDASSFRMTMEPGESRPEPEPVLRNRHP